MTDKTINILIDTLNKKQRKEHTFVRELDCNIDLAKIFTDNPKSSDNLCSDDITPYTFYCIKNKENKYVGLVLDMDSDLHWFIKKEHRGNGYLTNALKNSILPYIFQNKRDEQRITINRNEIGANNFNSSQKVALSVGFVQQNIDNNKCEYLLKSDDYVEKEMITEVDKELTQDELTEIAKKIGFYSKKLIRLQVDLEMRYGSTNETIFEFKEKIKNLRYSTCDIEDIWYEHNNKLENV
jgi:hypothetical protein